MPKIVREDVDSLNAVLSITIEPSDIDNDIKTELSKFKQKAHLKGFRKGKTPMGFIKKMYGQSIIVDIVNKTIEKQLNDFITEEKIDLLGQPLPSTNQEQIELDINNKEQLVFKFDIGLSPQIEVKGLKDNTFQKYAVEIPDAIAEEELKTARKRMGVRESTDKVIEEDDMLQFNAEELDGDALKKDGWATTFHILVKDVADESVKEQLLTMKKGDKVRFNINKIEGDKDEAFVRKHLLNVEEADADVVIGEMFEGTISDVTRLVDAEMDQAFFDKFLGVGKVTSEAEAKDFIKKDIAKHYDTQADSLMFRDIRDQLMEANSVSLPDEFLKRWLVTSHEGNTPEMVEKDYDSFSKNLKWTIIRNNLQETHKVEVKPDDIVARMKQKVMGVYGQYLDAGMLETMTQRLLSDREQYNRVFEEEVTEKVFLAVKEVVTIQEMSISKEDFEAKVQAINEEINAQNQAVNEIAAGEEE